MMNWMSERQSLAEHFAQRAQSASQYLLSSRASRKLHEEGDEAAEEIERFKIEIEKRYLLSVANKFYSFPYTELSFDNPVEDQDIADMIGKGLYCLYVQSDSEFPPDSVVESGRRMQQSKDKSDQMVTNVLQQLRSERVKVKEMLQIISSRRVARNEQRNSRSKQRKLGYKYGVIRQQDEELLRKRLYTQPYEKQTGFIMKKK